MPIFEIPVDATEDAYSQVTDLGGSDYEIGLRWNSRAEFWTLSLRTALGADVALGLVLAPGTLLLSRIVGDDRPPGEIVCTGDSALVGRDELGVNALLLYVDGDELAELREVLP